MTLFKNAIYFSADGGDGAGYELWKYDGVNPPVRVADIYPGSVGSEPRSLEVFKGKLYFAADGNDGTGEELWAYDGLNPPNRVADIFSGPTSSSPTGMTVFNGQLYFRAKGDNATGSELWKYDGANPPSLVADIFIGSGSSGPSSLTVYNNKLYFNAQDSFMTGHELWVYDGVNPPSMVAEIFPGGKSGYPNNLVVYNNILFFSAKDGTHGYEMWFYDGTNPPTLMSDLWPGVNGSEPHDFTRFDNKLYFSANDGSGAGWELWSYYDDSVGPTFADTPASHWAYGWIERLYDSGITGGCSANPLNYCPESPVTRAQMAVFLEKSLHGTAFSPADGPATFSDTAGHWAEDWIEALKSDGITSGCGAGMYCPEDSVTRAQMAVFLLKAKYGSSYSPPAASGVKFTDVPSSHWAAAWIEQLAVESITSGCATGMYCPENPVTRAQMAVFLVRTFSIP
jgi:ELWxxDGT repeat protein